MKKICEIFGLLIVSFNGVQHNKTKNIFVLAEELETNDELQVDDIDETTNLFDEKLQEEQKSLELEFPDLSDLSEGEILSEDHNDEDIIKEIVPEITEKLPIEELPQVDSLDESSPDDLEEETWGNCSFTFDENTGMITVKEGTLTQEFPTSLDKSEIRKIKLESGVKAPEDSSYLFANMSHLEGIEGNLDISSVRNMEGMFYGDISINSLNVSEWDTSHVSNMLNMFFGTNSLQTIIMGEKSIFDNSTGLPMIDISSKEYSGRWIRIEPENPASIYENSAELMSYYNGSNPGVYVWELYVIEELEGWQKFEAFDEFEELEGWQNENGEWYYYDSGKMQTDWQKIGNTWYYFNSDGVMQTSWLQQGNIRYYLSRYGAMETNWLKVDNTWYYFNNNGTMQTGWLQQGNIWYYFNSNGAMQTGWLHQDNTWYYFNNNGIMQTGWLEQGSQWYYLSRYGAMETNWLKVDNTWYYFNNKGIMQTGWLKKGNQWYYLSRYGAMETNWLKVDNTWYYFNNNGMMQTGWLEQGNQWYYLNSNGVMQTGWLKQENQWYYFNSSGAMVTDWLKIDDTWYYFGGNGAMQTDYRKVVLLDPGHGGSESGAYEYGVAEKKLNLQIGNLVRDELEKLGYLVIMTRTDDTAVSLLDRSKFSNNLEPDIFVSIHHNAMPNNLTQVNGIVTFYYEYDSDYPSKINEEMHNDPVRLEQSRLLSESIQRSLISNTGAVNMGVDRNTFAVLRETAAPATLVELGFMTNYNEFQQITNSNYQKKLANGIVNGINQYFKF